MSLEEKKVFHEDVEEEKVLEDLGYQQELKRSFGLFGMIGFAFSIVTSWTALGGVLIVGVESGGPPVMIYSWIAVSIFGLAVAYSMAEMCSAYPIAVRMFLYGIAGNVLIGRRVDSTPGSQLSRRQRSQGVCHG